MSHETFIPQVLRSFGGLCSLIERSELPLGLAAQAQDVEFLPNVVKSRDGFASALVQTSGVNSIKSFVKKGVRYLLVWRRAGVLSVEQPEGTQTTPSVDGISSVAADRFMSAVGIDQRCCLAIAPGPVTLTAAQIAAGQTLDPEPPWYFDPTGVINLFSGTTNRRVSLNGPDVTGTATRAAGGAIVDGARFWFFCYEDGYGHLSRAGPIGAYAAPGVAPSTINWAGVPLGPAGVVARRIAITLAGGDVGGPYFSISPLRIPDNTTTLLNGTTFTEAQLAAGQHVEHLILREPLPPVAGMCSFGDRLVGWRPARQFFGIFDPIGRTNAINALALDSRGSTGTNKPSGWTLDAAPNGISMIDGQNGQPNFSLLIASGFGDPALHATLNSGSGVLIPGRLYALRVRLLNGSASVGNLTIKIHDGAGTIFANLAIATTFAGMPTTWTTFQTAVGAQYNNGLLRADIIQGGGLVGSYEIGDITIVDPNDGDNDSALWVSVDETIEDFDPLRSIIRVGSGNGEKVQQCYEQSGNLYAAKDRSLWSTTPNGDDPSTWPVDQISPVVGAFGPFAIGRGNKFALHCCRAGVFRFDGGEPEKVSHEIEPLWATIDPAQYARVWCVVWTEKQCAFIGIPTNTAIAGCDKLLKLDFIEGWDDGVGNVGHGRKWSVETRLSNCGEIAERDDKSNSFFVGWKSAGTNDIPDSGVFTFGPWTNAGTVNPTVTTPGGAGNLDPLASQTAVTQWAYAAAAAKASITPIPTVNMPIGAYETISFWMKLVSPGTSWPVTVDGGAAGSQAITVTTSWQRFVVTLGPKTGVGAQLEGFTLNFGVGPVTVQIYGVSIQAGLYDAGYVATSGGPATGVETGVVGKRVKGMTFDADQPLTPIYETAPFGSEIGRSNYDTAVLRMRGSGVATVSWVKPDNTTLQFRATPSLTDPALDDPELKSNPIETYLALRIALVPNVASAVSKAAYFVLRRLAVLYKDAEYSWLKGKG